MRPQTRKLCRAFSKRAQKGKQRPLFKCLHKKHPRTQAESPYRVVTLAEKCGVLFVCNRRAVALLLQAAVCAFLDVRRVASRPVRSGNVAEAAQPWLLCV